MQIFNPSKKTSAQKGSALISALCIMAIVTIAATTLSLRMQLESYRAQLTLTYDKLSLASQVITFWAMDVLSHPPKKPWISQDNTGKILTFPAQWQAIYPETCIKGTLYDLQARFNLNNLINQNAHPSFLRFIETLKLSLEAAEKQALLAGIVHWISSPQKEYGQTPQTAAYLNGAPPYLPSQQFLAHLSELRLINGIDAKIYQRLLTLSTALPEATPINLNTAPDVVLASLGKGLTNDGIDAFLKARGKNGFKTIQPALPLLKKYQIPQEQITIESRYFLSVAYAHTGRMKLSVYTVLKRELKNKVWKTSIVSQSINNG